MPKKTKAKKMPADFYNMKAFNERDKKIKMKDVFGVSSTKSASVTKGKTNKKKKD